MGVPFHHHEVGHLHGAVFAHAAQVVAPQVHQHDVLGPFLGVRLQVGLQGRVLFWGAPPRPGACDGSGFGHAVPQTDQHLRRRADKAYPRPAPQVQVEHVGGRIEATQHPVDAQRMGAGGAGEPLGKYHLEDVAGRDVFLGPPHHGLEGFLREVGAPGFAFLERWDGGRSRQGGIQAAEQVLHAGFGPGAGVFQGLTFPGFGQHEGQYVATYVVKGQEHFRDDQPGPGQVQVVLGLLGQAFEEADHIVGPVAHPTAVEGRQVGGGQAQERLHLQGLGDLTQHVQWVLAWGKGEAPRAVRREELHAVGEDPGLKARAQSKEGIAANVGGLLHAFQQEQGQGALDLEQYRDGRFGVQG